MLFDYICFGTSLKQTNELDKPKLPETHPDAAMSNRTCASKKRSSLLLGRRTAGCWLMRMARLLLFCIFK